MPVFPSKEWCEEAIRLANADPESVQASRGWTGDFGAVVDAERGKLEKPFAVHVVPRDGVIQRFKVLADPDDLDEIEPAYVARAPYSVWKGLLQGTLDPIEALVRRQISLQGDAQPLIERMQHKSIAERVLSKISTTFPDEVTP